MVLPTVSVFGFGFVFCFLRMCDLVRMLCVETWSRPSWTGSAPEPLLDRCQTWRGFGGREVPLRAYVIWISIGKLANQEAGAGKRHMGVCSVQAACSPQSCAFQNQVSS